MSSIERYHFGCVGSNGREVENFKIEVGGGGPPPTSEMCNFCLNFDQKVLKSVIDIGGQPPTLPYECCHHKYNI